MKARTPGVLAIYDAVDTTIDGIRALRKEGRKKMTVITPVPYHQIAEELDTSPSPVRLCTFIGGLVGGILGFTLAAWTSLDWPLVTNGKEIVSIPPFMVIWFECTVLIGGLTNLFAMLFFAGLPDVKTVEGYDARFAADRIGIFVPVSGAEAEKVAGLLRGSGAEEVRVEAA
jgi:molybdopterin-containing oxidoreductase family membrane subunit